MPQFLAYRKTCTRGNARDLQLMDLPCISSRYRWRAASATRGPEVAPNLLNPSQLPRNRWVQASQGEASIARGYHTQRAHHTSGRCATLRSETKCKRYRGSHPLAVVPVRTEKGVPGDGDALLLYQGFKVQGSWRRRLAGSDRRFRATTDAGRMPALPVAKFQGCKVQAGQTPNIHLQFGARPA